MASPAAKTKKGKAGKKPASTASGAGWLRPPDAPRYEHLFKPVSTLNALAGVLLSSGGAVLAGAGFFAQFLRGEGPSPSGPYMLVGGVLMFLAGLFLSSRAERDVRVGDAGVAADTSKGLVRIGWHEVESIASDDGALTFRASEDRVVAIRRGPQPHAFAKALIEARARIPARVGSIREQVTTPPKGAGEQVKLPPPQLAGLHCRASDKLIAFEHDARLCVRCGETYHVETAPDRCLACAT